MADPSSCPYGNPDELTTVDYSNFEIIHHENAVRTPPTPETVAAIEADRLWNIAKAKSYAAKLARKIAR